MIYFTGEKHAANKKSWLSSTRGRGKWWWICYMESPRQGNKVFTVVKKRICQGLKLLVKHGSLNFHWSFRLKNKIKLKKVVGSTAGLTLELVQVRKSPVLNNPFKVTNSEFKGEVHCTILLTWFPWGILRGGEKDMILTGFVFIQLATRRVINHGLEGQDIAVPEWFFFLTKSASCCAVLG